jgi:hypothetical protein
LPTCELIHSSTIHTASSSFLLVFLIVLAVISLLGRSICVAQIDNQQSGGVVTVRVQRSVRSHHHQRRDLHQPTYLYLLEDEDLTSHHSTRWLAGDEQAAAADLGIGEN